MAAIPFTEGRIVWKAAGVDDAIGRPVRQPGQAHPRTEEWLLGEALTCLYVGLGRYHRGEKLSAQRSIQHYAVDRVLELVEMVTTAMPVPRDQFAVERRYEQQGQALFNFKDFQGRTLFGAFVTTVMGMR